LSPSTPLHPPKAGSDISIMDTEAFDEPGGVISDNDDNARSDMEVAMNPEDAQPVDDSTTCPSGRAVANKSYLGRKMFFVFT